MRGRFFAFVALLTVSLGVAGQAPAAELLVGAASADITPSMPAALLGQHHLRISQKVETPLTANALVLESRNAKGKSLDMAVMVSCDLLRIPQEALDLVREEVGRRLPELNVQKLFLSATHTHTAPVVGDKLNDWSYAIPKQGVVQVEQYQKFLAQRIAEAIERAWKGRKPGSVSWGLGHAVVAYNRRAVYADGHAEMYGKTDRHDFRALEGYEDHDVGSLFFWDAEGKPIAVAVNVACPSQEVESSNVVDADFWHPTRELLRKRLGSDVCVLGWTGAAGDQSPHLMYRKAADNRMTQLRGLTRMQEIARRIDRAVEEAHDAVKNDRHADVAFAHRVETVRLPARLVTEAEYAEAKAAYRQAADKIAKNPKEAQGGTFGLTQGSQRIIERFENQKPGQAYDIELHVIRLGDAVICTNPFELFTDYGIQMKARSPAVQTFIIQLVGHGSYLPTEKAVRGGSYSAKVSSNLVGPEGGQVLVDRTVELINELWQQKE